MMCRAPTFFLVGCLFFLWALGVLGQGDLPHRGPTLVNAECQHQEGGCVCRTALGVINLAPLDTNNIEHPRFLDVWDIQEVSRFSFNPCSTFSRGNGDFRCDHVNLCQRANDRYYPLGGPDSAEFILTQDRGLVLKTSSQGPDRPEGDREGGILRTAQIQLMCDPSVEGKLSAIGESVTQGHYYLSLTSKYACPHHDEVITSTESTTHQTPTGRTPQLPTPPPLPPNEECCDCYGWQIICIFLASFLGLGLLTALCFMGCKMFSCRDQAPKSFMITNTSPAPAEVPYKQFENEQAC